jgi:hypothetical protein
MVGELNMCRWMGEGILLPNGKVLLVNGARTGVAGNGNVSRFHIFLTLSLMFDDLDWTCTRSRRK